MVMTLKPVIFKSLNSSHPLAAGFYYRPQPTSSPYGFLGEKARSLSVGIFKSFVIDRQLLLYLVLLQN